MVNKQFVTFSNEFDNSAMQLDKVKSYLKSKEKLLRRNNIEQMYEECPRSLRGDVSDFLLSRGFNIFLYLTYIPDYCFDLSMINSIQIPPTITYLGEHAFSLSWLESIDIPGTIKEIGNRAFSGCEDLKSVKIRPGVQTIGEFAFMNCDDLDYIELPNTIISIGRDAFKGVFCEITCPKDSYAEQYCIDNDRKYAIK